MDTQGQQQQDFNYNGIDTISSNSQFNSALQLRLDCDPLLSDIKDFLSGTSTYQEFDEKTGRIVWKTQAIGEPLANQKGIQALMMSCRLMFNPQAVQGNYNDERYNLDRKMNREDLAFLICLNRKEWGIQPKKQELIVDRIIGLAKMFNSRTLDNKERESYTTTMQSKESHTIQPIQEKKGFGF